MVHSVSMRYIWYVSYDSYHEISWKIPWEFLSSKNNTRSSTWPLQGALANIANSDRLGRRSVDGWASCCWSANTASQWIISLKISKYFNDIHYLIHFVLLYWLQEMCNMFHFHSLSIFWRSPEMFCKEIHSGTLLLRALNWNCYGRRRSERTQQTMRIVIALEVNPCLSSGVMSSGVRLGFLGITTGFRRIPKDAMTLCSFDLFFSTWTPSCREIEIRDR